MESLVLRTNGGGAHSRRLSLVAAIVDADPVCDGGPYTPDSNLEAFILNVLKSMRRGMAAARCMLTGTWLCFAESSWYI